MHIQHIFRPQRQARVYGRLRLCADQHGSTLLWINQRNAVNRALFSADTPADEVKRLRQTAGTTHPIFSRQFDGSEAVISEVFEKIYDGENVRIYSTGARPLGNHPLYQEQLAEYADKQD